MEEEILNCMDASFLEIEFVFNIFINIICILLLLFPNSWTLPLFKGFINCLYIDFVLHLRMRSQH